MTLETDFEWPNQISLAPKGALAGTNGDVIVVPDGFLVPGKDSGGIYLVLNATDASPVVQAVKPKTFGHFYHMVQWVDMDGDGWLDILTARANGVFKFTGELLWFKNPGQEGQYPWTEHVLATGPDVFIETYKPTTEVLLVIEFRC